MSEKGGNFDEDERDRSVELSHARFNKIARQQQREAFNKLPVVRQASELEELPREQLRQALKFYGLDKNPVRLRELTEASLKLVGDEEHSAIVAALESEEIGEIVSLSPQIFSTDKCDLIHPDDYKNPDKWILIPLATKEAIVASGNQKLIDRLANLHEEPWAQKAKNGPWGLFKQPVAISPEAVFAYVSAIANASKRSDEWKIACFDAIGFSLIAYVAKKMPELQIISICNDIDPDLGQRISALMSDPCLEAKALEGTDLAMAVFEEQPDSREPQKDLSRLVDELRKMGVNDPGTEEIGALAKDEEILNAALRKGVSEEKL